MAYFALHSNATKELSQWWLFMYHISSMSGHFKFIPADSTLKMFSNTSPEVFIASISPLAQIRILDRAFDKIDEIWQEKANNLHRKIVDESYENQNQASQVLSEDLIAEYKEFSKFEKFFEFIESLRKIETELQHNRKIDKTELDDLSSLWREVKLYLFNPCARNFFKIVTSRSTLMKCYTTGEELCHPHFLISFLAYTYEELYGKIHNEAKKSISHWEEIENEYPPIEKEKEYLHKELSEEEIEELVPSIHDVLLRTQEEYLGEKNTKKNELDENEIKELVAPPLHLLKNSDISLSLQEKQAREEEEADLARYVQEKNQKEHDEPLKKETVIKLTNKIKLKNEKIRDQETKLFIEKVISDEIQKINTEIKKTKYGKKLADEKIAAWNNLQYLLDNKPQDQTYTKLLTIWKNQTILHKKKLLTYEQLMAKHRHFSFFQIFKKTKTKSTRSLEKIKEEINAERFNLC